MLPAPRNIFSDIPFDMPDELTEILSGTGEIRIERIVSRGQSSPEDFWYDQDKNEFVILLKGKAELLFESGKEAVVMEPGDFLDIPAGTRHRVEWTDSREDTVWLAIHY